MKKVYTILLLLPLGLKMNAQFGPACSILGDLSAYHMVFTNGSVDANWQGTHTGYLGNVAINGVLANEHSSGVVPYSGIMLTNANSLGQWQNIVNANQSQSSYSTIQTEILVRLETGLEAAFTTINALPATPGYTARSSSSLNNLNTEDGLQQTIVINITSGFTVTTKIHITGDACDLFILRWDNNANPVNGYNGQVKFKSGAAIVPHGGLSPVNFIHVAGDIYSTGGGTTPPPPYPQGPRYSNGFGPLIEDGEDFDGGGFFTGYWLTTGAPTIFPAGKQPYGPTATLDDAIFVGGWYSKTTKFTMDGCRSGGVYIDGCSYRKNGSVEMPVEKKVSAFTATVMGNPSYNDFTIYVNTNSKEAVTMQVMDMSGKLINVINQQGGTTYTSFGANLVAGSYYVVVKQGNDRQVIKLVKL